MSLWYLILTIVALGIVAYAINRWAPMSPAFKTIANLVLVAVALFVVLEAFGVIDVLKSTQIGKGGR